MTWRLEFARGTREKLRSLEKPTRRAIGYTLRQLQEDFGSVSLKKLKGRDSEFRIRVGTFRVLFGLDSPNNTIIVFSVDDRKDVYC